MRGGKPFRHLLRKLQAGDSFRGMERVQTALEHIRLRILAFQDSIGFPSALESFHNTSDKSHKLEAPGRTHHTNRRSARHESHYGPSHARSAHDPAQPRVRLHVRPRAPHVPLPKQAGKAEKIPAIRGPRCKLFSFSQRRSDYLRNRPAVSSFYLLYHL